MTLERLARARAVQARSRPLMCPLIIAYRCVHIARGATCASVYMKKELGCLSSNLDYARADPQNLLSWQLDGLHPSRVRRDGGGALPLPRRSRCWAALLLLLVQPHGAGERGTGQVEPF